LRRDTTKSCSRVVTAGKNNTTKGKSTRWRSSETATTICIQCCSIENLGKKKNPWGCTPGIRSPWRLRDADDREYHACEKMRRLAVLRQIRRGHGGSKCAIAVNPRWQHPVIEMKSGVSRSSVDSPLLLRSSFPVLLHFLRPSLASVFSYLPYLFPLFSLSSFLNFLAVYRPLHRLLFPPMSLHGVESHRLPSQDRRPNWRVLHAGDTENGNHRGRHTGVLRADHRSTSSPRSRVHVEKFPGSSTPA